MTEPKPISLSHSSLQILQSCPLRYQMSRIEGRSRIGMTRGRRRGSAFSDAMEHRNPEMIEKAYDAWIMEAVSQSLVDDLVIERQVVAELYAAHAQYFGDDDEREIFFELPIKDAPGYVNRGYIDGVNWTGSDLRLEEDKLMMMWGRADEAALMLNGQVLRYLGAAEMLYADKLGELELRYRVTKYPSTYRKKDESAKQYADKVCMQIRTKLAKKPEELFVVNTIKLSDPAVRSAVDRYYRDLTEWALIEGEHRHHDRWPANYGDACKAYGGCEFLPACTQEPGFEMLYTQRETSK